METGGTGGTGRPVLPPAPLKGQAQSPGSNGDVCATTLPLPRNPLAHRAKEVTETTKIARDCPTVHGASSTLGDGNWGSWSPSGPCSVTCGIGRVVEKRQCNNPEPKYGGRNCPGQDTRNNICNTGVPCPVKLHVIMTLFESVLMLASGHLKGENAAVNGQWREWSSWSKCERLGANFKINCEDIAGMQSRTRLCTGRAHNGKNCIGDRIEMRSCYDVSFCMLAGTWTDWSPWSLCEPSCGPNPVKTRVRECKPTYANYPKQVEGQNGELHDVGFWGKPIPQCQPLEGQKFKVEQKAPCLNVPPCEGWFLGLSCFDLVANFEEASTLNFSSGYYFRLGNERLRTILTPHCSNF
ncbi:hypothetical protein JD844_010569 [Phrynosoma platyrhinos]|uniref:Uncharacterized protein n=1 Tax=Phrynosoma platyrhinos TaxID=52577 RepID=A0ABQ7THT0_PHRPL|nr:hypothetical protein JD844_010569 [Phrynosoma platyrhinos]